MSQINDTKIALTRREIEIMDYISKGHTNIEISGILKLSENTVKVHLSNIYKKLNVTNRTEAVLCYKKGHIDTKYNCIQSQIKPILILGLFSHNDKDPPNNNEDDYFSLKLQTKLLVGLSNRNIFTVIKDNTVYIPEKIDCIYGYRISGSIYKSSNSINITVCLESYPQNVHIWSNIFHESRYDLDIDWIANKIIASLMYYLISRESSTSVELEIKGEGVFQRVLRGLHLLNLSDGKSLLEAQKVFDSILTLAPSNILALYGKGVIAYILIMTDLSKKQSADYLIIKNCCMHINSILKDCVENWFLRGLLALLDQDIKGAIILFQNSLRHDYSRQETFLMLAQLYTAVGDYHNAKSNLEKAISLCPDFQYRGNNPVAISIVYFGLKQYEDSIKLLEENFYIKEQNMLSKLLYICSLYYAGFNQKACELSKDINVNQTYLKRIFSLSNEDIFNCIMTAFNYVGIKII